MGSSNDSSFKHNSSPEANLQTKEHNASAVLYLSSEEFNALRKELYDHWRDDPGSITGKDLWYYSGLMVTNPQAFVEIMSLELGLQIVFDSGKEAEICFTILNALRKRRGVHTFGRA